MPLSFSVSWCHLSSCLQTLIYIAAKLPTETVVNAGNAAVHHVQHPSCLFGKLANTRLGSPQSLPAGGTICSLCILLHLVGICEPRWDLLSSENLPLKIAGLDGLLTCYLHPSFPVTCWHCYLFPHTTCSPTKTTIRSETIVLQSLKRSTSRATSSPPIYWW